MRSWARFLDDSFSLLGEYKLLLFSKITLISCDQTKDTLPTPFAPGISPLICTGIKLFCIKSMWKFLLFFFFFKKGFWRAWIHIRKEITHTWKRQLAYTPSRSLQITATLPRYLKRSHWINGELDSSIQSPEKSSMYKDYLCVLSIT